MPNEIVKKVELVAPVSRVWRAIADHEEFGRWFRVRLDQPFVEGALSTGQMTYPGHEDMPWRATVERVEPERLLSFRWHDFDESSDADIADQPTTLVSFRLEPVAGGTLLTITESGFDALPDDRRIAAMRSNTEGWNIQADNLTSYLSAG